MSFDQHVPKGAPDTQPSGASKPRPGPWWVAGARAPERHTFAGELWTVTKVRQNGRVIYWRSADGRGACTEITPTHPDYPKDPTPKQLKQEAAQDAYDAQHEQEWGDG